MLGGRNLSHIKARILQFYPTLLIYQNGAIEQMSKDLHHRRNDAKKLKCGDDEEAEDKIRHQSPDKHYSSPLQEMDEELDHQESP